MSDIETSCINEQETIVLILPLPPSLNSYYGHTAPAKHRVIKYVKPKGKEFVSAVNDYVKKNSFNLQINIPITVEVIINFATNAQQDLDNRMKCLLDSLTMAEVFLDDSLIYELHIIKGQTKKPGSVIVKISEYIE